MSGPTQLLRHARRRAEEARPRYRAAGFWAAEPVDLVRFTAARHPARLAVANRDTEVTYGELDKRIDSTARAMVDAGVAPGSAVVLVVG
ncbi:MAG: AMP-dependent synthetase, partial [Mycobacterium sp.]|uniref:AMP-binding protein n=1 Tax=Mycobacterium sp. TaxID=1785 RepID=UPI001ECAE05A